jgi:hypothetical protein
VCPAPSIGPLVDRLCARFEVREEGLAILTDLMVLIASADAVIDAAETKALMESLERMLVAHVAPRLARVVVGESRTRIRGLGPDLSADAIGRKLALRGASEDGVRLAVYMASVSDGISNAERKRIERLAHAAGVSSARLAELMVSPFAS